MRLQARLLSEPTSATAHTAVRCPANISRRICVRLSDLKYGLGKPLDLANLCSCQDVPARATPADMPQLTVAASFACHVCNRGFSNKEALRERPVTAFWLPQLQNTDRFYLSPRWTGHSQVKHELHSNLHRDNLAKLSTAAVGGTKPKAATSLPSGYQDRAEKRRQFHQNEVALPAT